MKKSGNDENEEIRMKLMGLGKNSMRKSYYRDLIDRQAQLENQNEKLEKEIIQRIEVENELKRLNDDLENRVHERTSELQASLEELRKTQEYLLQTERLVALGSLVAGISHEINTPLGIGVTSSTYLIKLLEDLGKKYKSGRLSKSEFEEHIEESCEIAKVVLQNLNRGVELVDSFKMIAMDQSHYEYRTFEVCSYFKSILSSLSSELKQQTVNIDFKCKKGMKMGGYPGVFSQIISNLVMNSLVHGFKDGGHIFIEFAEDREEYIIKYSDDGIGMDKSTLRRIFDPFFTTQMGSGSGLGMYIVYNLVTNHLAGTIEIESKLNEGIQLIIRFPKENNMV